VRQEALKNVLMNDGTARRLPVSQAETLLEGRQAKRYISNTVYRALKLGIEVKNLNTRDEDGALRERIVAVREKTAAAAHKAKQKQKKKEEAD
jgi:hypothetical protein